MSNTHDQYMAEALLLAKRGTGHVSPNPRVGCVVVKNNEVVGRGWHQQFGGPHAEVNALREAADRAIGSTVYVSLEPCAHQGKTPPCVEALITAKVSKVVIAARDPHPDANGGAIQLEKAGIDVVMGVQEAQARAQNRMFFHHIEHQRPWVIGKTATSLDGRIATHKGHSQWITGPAARQRGHDLRQMVDGIVVGAETLRKDNPSLTVRERWDNELASLEPAHPLRIIITRCGSGIQASDFQALDGSLPGKALVATTEQMPEIQASQLTQAGTEVLRLPANAAGQIDIKAFLNALSARCQSLMVEGGSQLLGAFVDANLVDEVWAFIAPKWIGGVSAPSAVGGLGAECINQSVSLFDVKHESLDPDLLVRGLVNRRPSPD